MIFLLLFFGWNQYAISIVEDLMHFLLTTDGINDMLLQYTFPFPLIFFTFIFSPSLISIFYWRHFYRWHPHFFLKNSHIESQRRTVHIINLDPAADDLKYEPSIGISTILVKIYIYQINTIILKIMRVITIYDILFLNCSFFLLRLFAKLV